MKKKPSIYIKLVVLFLTAGFVLVGFGGASIVGPNLTPPVETLEFDQTATETLAELNHLGILCGIPQAVLEDLLLYQRRTGKPLAQIMVDPVWTRKLGLTSSKFKATWYAANPFDFLPSDLQKAIRRTSTSFETRSQVEKWSREHHASERWVRSLNAALIETTPANLWRASRGQRPFAKNGQYLEPIVVDHGQGNFEARDGHIATDPRIIPTNSIVFLVVRINGKQKILKVKATDIGQGVRGSHVDLPIRMRPAGSNSLRFPKEYIRNPNVMILKITSRGRKA